MGNIFNILSCILFFMMIFFPMAYQIPKIVFIALLFIGMVIKFVRKEIFISNKINIWYLSFIMYGLIWGYYGIIKSNPGAIEFIRLNVAWVIIYFLFTIFIDEHLFKKLFNTIIYSTMLISIYNILAVIDNLGWFQFKLYEFLETGTRIGIHPGYIQITTHNIASLTYTVPFIITVYIMIRSGYKFNVSSRIVFITMMLSMITVILSGRRALMIVTIVTPFLIIPISYMSNIKYDIKKGLKKYILLIILLVFIPSINILKNISVQTINLYMERFLGAFTSSEQVERMDQFNSLIDGFRKYPVIGSGPGVGVDVVRNNERPWIYELSYMQQLYNTGILGISIYVILIGYLYVRLFMIIRKEKEYTMYIIPIIIGMTSFLIANATNPYLGKYDHMWTIFLTTSIINILNIKFEKEASL